MARVNRNFSFDRASINKEKRTCEMCFSSESAVDRGWYDEILDHGSVDLTRMERSAPLLLNHDTDKQIGVVESAQIKGKKGYATVRFGNSALAEEIWKDVQDGIRSNVSVGYERTGAISREKNAKGDRDMIRFAWTPMELTIASIPADLDTGVGRSHPIENDNCKTLMKMNRSLNFAPDAADGNGNTTTATVDAVKVGKDARAQERVRFNEINAAAEALTKVYPEAAEKFRTMAQKAIGEDHTPAQFNNDLLLAIPGIRKTEVDRAALGMTDKEKKRYSILRGFRSLMDNDGKLEGFEREVHDELKKRGKEDGIKYSGGMNMLVPTDVTVDMRCSRQGALIARALGQNIGRRDLNVTTATQGGDFVQTELQTTVIEILRNRVVLDRLGMQMLSGLQGNVAISRQTGAATAYSLAESALLTLSTQAINQIGMSPKRIGATNNYTKQLLLQSSIPVEQFVREDLMRVVAIKIDSLGLNGQGSSSEPTGIFNTTGIGAVTFGATATWAKILAFETALALGNADIGDMAFITSPDVRGAWKNIPKIAASTFPIFLWEGLADYGVGTSNDGIVNGYRAAATNQIQNSRCVFGHWSELICGMWGGLDIVLDPYTLAQNAEVKITVNTFIDLAVRHAASFCASTDSANQ